MSDADRIFLLFMVAALGGMLLAPLAAALLDAGRRLVAAIPRAQGGLLAPWREPCAGRGVRRGAAMSFVSRNHPQQVAVRGALDEVDGRGTDQAFFDSLSERFGGFTLDVAAAPHNAKAQHYFTRADDGLSQPWSGRVWCNPPYSDCGAWVRKAWAEFGSSSVVESRRSIGGAEVIERDESRCDLIVMLLPANRVEQAWWQDSVEPFRDRLGSPLRVEFLRGRMRFDRPNAVIGPKGDRPPFGCCLLIWSPLS